MRTAQLIAEHGARTEKSSQPTEKKPDGRGKHRNPRSLANLAAPWKPGQSGNPQGGRRHDKSAEIARAAIENNAEAIYKAVVAKLTAGDAYAFSVYSDRAYGKMKQGIIHTGDEDGGPVKTSIKIEFVEPDGK